jgi:diaminopimelate decarboxylase
MSKNFSDRLNLNLKAIVKHFGTPFHIYDEAGIISTGEQLKKAFANLPNGFREYFAVKALPNPSILKIMKDLGFGFDCSSIPEISLSQIVEAKEEDIMFTSNNTSKLEFDRALMIDSIINIDDISLFNKLPRLPQIICFRYNPGSRRQGNSILGNPEEAKYGVTHEQIIEAYRLAKNKGVKRFGLHTMIVSNELNYFNLVKTAGMLLSLAEELKKELDIKLEFVNIGGGLGIPYKPESKGLDLLEMAEEITRLFKDFQNKNGYCPKLLMESGRYMTGPHGVLITTCINKKDIYRKYCQVDACMSSLMRPGIYGAYHHITVLGKDDSAPQEKVDVAGSLCENNDKFAIERMLPQIEEGDILIIHDTGAHGHAMGFNYNGRLRPQELLLTKNGEVKLIRREETMNDYFATLDFKKNILKL